MTNNKQYISGKGKKSIFPPELKGWNWGAFFWNWIWGLGNKTYIALLMFVPFVNIIMVFVLGAKGNEWAWQNKTWKDVEHFKQVQRKWAWSGLLFLVLSIIISIGSISYFLKGEIYNQSLLLIKSDSRVVQWIGGSIEPSYFITGTIQSNALQGKINLSYSIYGNKNEAKVYVEGIKEKQKWILTKLIVYNKNKRINIQTVSPAENSIFPSPQSPNTLK